MTSAGAAAGARPRIELPGPGPRAWALAAVGLHVLLALALYDPTLFTGGDNAGYMVLGESLRTGRGYLDLYLPQTPVHTKYPPGYPAVLALLGLVGGVQLFKLFSLACTAAATWLVFHLGRRIFDSGTGAAAALLFAVNPVALEYSHWVLSEALFLAVVLLSLWAHARDAPKDGGREKGPRDGPARGGDGDGGEGRRPGWPAGVAAGVGAYLVRTAGLPLLLAPALVQAARRQWRRLATSVVAGGGVILAWAAVQRAGGGGTGYLQEFLLRNPYDPAAGKVGAAGLVTRAAGNLWAYVSMELPRSVTGAGPEGSLLLTGLGLLVTLLALAGWILRAREQIGVSEVFTVLYAGLVCLWPAAWIDRRFLLPLLPLLLLYAVGGTTALAARWRKTGEEPAAGGGAAPRAAVAAVVLLLGLPGGADALSLAPERVRCVAAYRSGEPCLPAPWRSFFAAAEWTRDNTPEDAVVVNRKPRLFYWISRRRGDVYRFSRESDLVIRGLDELEADYVVVDPLTSTTALYLVPAVEAYRDRFALSYGGGEPPTYVLLYRPAPARARTPSRPRDGSAAATGLDAPPGDR